MTDFPLILVKRLKALLMFRTREIAILIVEIRLLAFDKARMLVPVSLRYPDVRSHSQGILQSDYPKLNGKKQGSQVNESLRAGSQIISLT